jgi:hypothetical protein
VTVGLGFGPVWQLGYVVADDEAAMEGWLAQGVGPWYVIHPFPVDRFSFREGDPSTTPLLTIALSHSGGVQVELIQQHDDTPTLYREFLARTGGGLQHLGYLPVDYEASLAAARAAGWGVFHQGSASGTRFCYLDGGGHPGTMAEIVDLDEGSRGLFAHIEDEAAAWDGATRPVRRLGQPR